MTHPTDPAPVLTAEEWKDEAWQRTRTTGPDWIQDTTIQGVKGALVIQREYPSHHHCVDTTTIQEYELPAVLALANHALPMDSPYKITEGMVDGIQALADGAHADRSYTIDTPCSYCGYHDSKPTCHNDPVHECPIFMASSWAAVLRALLPPAEAGE